MTFGQKLKEARKEAKLTQEELADKLGVSRQAVSKWEADKGMPDIENIKLLSSSLNVSIDYLLDDGESLELNVFRKMIDINSYEYTREFKHKFFTKFMSEKKLGKANSAKKDMYLLDRYPDAKIYLLIDQQILTKTERIFDEFIFFFTFIPGIFDLLFSINNNNTTYYLVEKGEAQYFIKFTDEYIETRKLAKRIENNKFELGKFKFTKSTYTIDENYK